jgi:predicted nucleic acid-binding protein
LAAAEAVHVVDSCAFIAFLQDEPGADDITRIMKEERCLIHAVNVCEVYYDLLRRDDLTGAGSLEDLLQASGLEIIAALPPDLWREAGRIKAELRRLSLADCFAMALTLQENGILVTSDHREFDPVAAAGLCPIHFIR